jgi:hypothetical protein
VDWFSDYEEEIEDERFLNVKPPNILVAVDRMEEQKATAESQPNIETSWRHKENDKDQELRKPKVPLKQNYFEHVQRVTKYNNDVTRNDFTKINVDLEILKSNYKIGFGPSLNDIASKCFA